MSSLFPIRRGRPAHLSVENVDVEKPSAFHSSDADDDGGEDRHSSLTEDSVRRGGRQVRTAAGRHDEQDEAAAAAEELLEDTDEPSVIVQLAARVQDGTRCRIGSLDMCIQGKCQVS